MSEKLKKLAATKDAAIKAYNDEASRVSIELFMPMVRALAGRCFVYRCNSYSSPEKPSDYWDVYYKVLSVLEDERFGHRIAHEKCSVDRDGRARISTDLWYACDENAFPFRLEDITMSEYDLKRAEVESEMHTLSKMYACLRRVGDE